MSVYTASTYLPRRNRQVFEDLMAEERGTDFEVVSTYLNTVRMHKFILTIKLRNQEAKWRLGDFMTVGPIYSECLQEFKLSVYTGQPPTRFQAKVKELWTKFKLADWDDVMMMFMEPSNHTAYRTVDQNDDYLQWIMEVVQGPSEREQLLAVAPLQRFLPPTLHPKVFSKLIDAYNKARQDVRPDGSPDDFRKLPRDPRSLNDYKRDTRRLRDRVDWAKQMTKQITLHRGRWIQEHVGAVGLNNDAALPQVGIEQPAGHHVPDLEANVQLLWEVPLNYDWLATLDDDQLDRAQANGFICEELGVVDFHNPNLPTNWLPPIAFHRMFFKKGQFHVLITQQEAQFLCERPAGLGDSSLTNIRNEMEIEEPDANLNVGGTHACNPFYRFVYFRGHGRAIIKALDLMSEDFENMYANMSAQERQQSTPFRPPVHTWNNRPMIVGIPYDRTNHWVARNVVYCLRCFGFRHLPGGNTCGQ